MTWPEEIKSKLDLKMALWNMLKAADRMDYAASVVPGMALERLKAEALEIKKYVKLIQEALEELDKLERMGERHGAS